MARNVVHLKQNENAGDGDGGGLAAGKVKVISERELTALIKKCKTAQAGMDTERATLSSYISDAIKNSPTATRRPSNGLPGPAASSRLGTGARPLRPHS